MSTATAHALPGLDCGLCGYRYCSDLQNELPLRPQLLERCVHLSDKAARPQAAKPTAKVPTLPIHLDVSGQSPHPWQDSLNRPFDFFLEKFPEEAGPREIIIPHNPMLTREMKITVGDTMIGRPLGMSCGCPITHCGVVTDVDPRTGVIGWCVTGPLKPRESGFKDIGYYIAEAYEGLITEARCDIQIGARYFFQPRLCMLQWRHSGLINYVNRTDSGLQVRIEGLWIG
jgi:uncharacterized Fe-S cluster-containing protein